MTKTENSGKKKGLAPTGGLAKQAKAAGYSSVADLLQKFPTIREERYTREDNAAVASPIQDSMPSRHVEPADESDAVQTFEAEKKSKQVKEDTQAAGSFRSIGVQIEGGKKKRRRRKKSEIEAAVSKFNADHAQGQSSAAEPEKDVVGESSKKKERKNKAKVRVDSVREDKVEDSAVGTHEEETVEEQIVLPVGTPLLNVGDLELPPEAIGLALQIVEFCSAFEKPLRIKRVKGQKILAEMLKGGTLRRGGQSDLVNLHVQLLSIILDDVDDDTNVAMSAASKNCWVYHLDKHLTEQFSILKKAAGKHSGEEDDGKSFSASASGSKSLPCSLWPLSDEDMTMIGKALRDGVDGYGTLSITTRLQLLATLCDDTMTTKLMRDYVEKIISSHEVEQKEIKEELLALKKQAREIHENDAKEVLAAKRDNLDPLSVRDLARVKREYAKLAEKESRLTETAAKLCGPRSDAMRTEPTAVHRSGSRFWRLKGVKDREVVVLQEIGNLERDVPHEAWSVFSEDQEDEVLQCITNLNTREKAHLRSMRRRRNKKGSVQVDCNDETTIVPESPNIPIIELSD